MSIKTHVRTNSTELINSLNFLVFLILKEKNTKREAKNFSIEIQVDEQANIKCKLIPKAKKNVSKINLEYDFAAEIILNEIISDFFKKAGIKQTSSCFPVIEDLEVKPGVLTENKEIVISFNFHLEKKLAFA